ncbi:MAG TPA: RnfABCDGE type electron transport complex subunit D [Thermoanaerobaculia bacterium]|nr:RnfABCDGE type electron transport complex subunit D [Thermoanaerobaculia bacterium]
MKRFDPRLYQIGALTLLLLYGVFALHFDVTLFRAVLLVGTAIGTQALCARLEDVSFDPRSAAISGLSLALLLRSEYLALLLAGAVIAVASKFVVRVRGKHVFNPTNVAIVALMLMSNRVWVSPGQWGNVAFFGFLITCLGGLVVNRAARSDITYAFIAAWSLLLIGRSLWVGEPMTIPIHRLENGALLLFTFFMISDPKTTPDSRAGRILFAALVAFGGWYINFRLFRTNGILWSLAASALVVPIIDVLLPADRYQWGRAASQSRGLAASSNRATPKPRDLATA